MKIKGLDELERVVKGLRTAGKTIVTTNGVFDMFHAVHLYLLQEAKKLGDVLIVAINSDSSVKRLKGEKRPIISESERATIVAALSCVDYVVIFGEDTPVTVLEKIRPDVHAKGGDYNLDELPERGVVEKNGGRIALVKFIKGPSTTDIIKRIKEAYYESGIP